MLTVFLWIALIFLFLLFLLAILPIRFNASAKYAGSECFNYEFVVSYFHPLFLKLRYSSENGDALKLLWKTFKLDQKKESEELRNESSEAIRDTDKKTIEPRQFSESERSSEESEEKSNYDSESVRSQNSESVKIYDETHEESEFQEEQASIFSKIKRSVEKIKKSKAYQFLSDAVLRKKVKSWLGRCLKSTMRVIVFSRLKIWAKAGLKDPAALGKLCGYFSAARSALSLRKRKVDMTLEPLFMKEVLEFEIELKGGTSLFRAISCSLIALVTFPYIRTYKVWRQIKKKRQ